MVNKINYRLFLSKHTNRQGKSKLYIQISILRKVKRYSLDVFINPDDYDKYKMIVSSGPDKDTINRLINREFVKIDEIYLYLRETGQDINITSFENCYFNRDVTKFSKVVDLHCQNIGYSSLKAYLTLKKQIIDLWGDLPINSIDLIKIEEYNTYLKRFKNNTAWTKHKNLKAVINTAIKHGIYKHENPYTKFKYRFVQTVRTHLSIDELNRIEGSIDAMPDLVKRVAVVFLFQCYTGLRYSDVSNLTNDCINGNYIVFKTEKTDEIINIPINARARRILDGSQRSGARHALLFRVPSNQKYNDYLKLMGNYARIDKNITSHVARHTFATISIELGMPIEIIGKILGHKELKTTKIYSKILNPVLAGYMALWD